jgi:hypothetical protein
LAVVNSANVLDLSALRFKFTVTGTDLQSPNTATIRVYNAAPETVNSIANGEFASVVLEAGYATGANYGVIFQGEIRRVYIGRERNVDSYIEVLAADGDYAYNFGLVNQTVGSAAGGGSSPDGAYAALKNHFNKWQLTENQNNGVALATGGVLAKGAVQFGLFRTQMRELTSTVNARWSIQNGSVTIIKDTNYLAGTTITLNSASGLVGTPEVTDNGINMRMLLNAKLRIGAEVILDQSLINKQINTQLGGTLTNSGQPYLPAVTAPGQGSYRVLVMNHTGDTRGTPWYTDITCLYLNAGMAQQYPK